MLNHSFNQALRYWQFRLRLSPQTKWLHIWYLKKSLQDRSKLRSTDLRLPRELTTAMIDANFQTAEGY